MAADPNMREEDKRRLRRSADGGLAPTPRMFTPEAVREAAAPVTTAFTDAAQRLREDGGVVGRFNAAGGLSGILQNSPLGMYNAAVAPYIFGSDPAAAATPPAAAEPALPDPRDAQGRPLDSNDRPLLTARQRNPENYGPDGTLISQGAPGAFTNGGPGNNLTQTNANGLRRTAYTRAMKDGVPTYDQVAFGTEGSTPVEYDPAAEKTRADAARELFAKNNAVFARDPATGEMRFQGSRAQVGAGAGALTPAQMIAAMQRDAGLALRRQQLDVMQANAARDDKRADETATTKKEETLLKRAAEDPKGYIRDFEAQVAQLPEDDKLAAFDTPEGRAALRAISANLAPKGQGAAGWMTNTVNEEGDFYDNLANYGIDDGGTYVNEPGSTILGSRARVDGLFGSNVSGIEKLAIEYARSRNNNLYRE